MEFKRLFIGRGQEQSGSYHELPVIDPDKLTSPQNYIASTGLAAAVETALILGMPLLLTGEPGCGKSQLAYRIAWELGFPGYQEDDDSESNKPNPIRFQVKSTTESRDLFYTFDTVGRFHASQNTDYNPDAMAPEKFITYQGLGLAILRAKGSGGREQINPLGTILNPIQSETMHSEPQRSVVLLDEIDKAPRDVPNDILNEIESLEFNIPELELTDSIGLDGEENRYRPVIVITSNSERDLPDAFLRRCVYYHVGFPAFSSDNGDDFTVEKIVLSRLGNRYSEKSYFTQHALELIEELRDDATDLNKAPSIAEILNWLDYFDKMQETGGLTIDQSRGLDQLDSQLLMDSVKNTLLKTSEDQQRVSEIIEPFLKSNSSS